MIEVNITDEDLMNIVNEVFEEMEVDNIIEEMDGESSDEDQPLSDDSATVIVVKTLQKLAKKLWIIHKLML